MGMEDKQAEKFLRNNLGTKLVLGSIGLAGLAAAAAWIFRNRKKQPDVYSVEGVIEILKEFRNEFYPLYYHVYCENIRMFSAVQADGMPITDEIRDEFVRIVYSENGFFKKEVREIEKKVNAKYHVDVDKFQHLVKEVYNNDPTVKALQKQMEGYMEDALNGQKPNCEIEIPKKFTPEMCIDLMSNISKGFISSVVNACLGIKEKDEKINADNQEFVDFINNNTIEAFTLKIFKAIRLPNAEDHPLKIYHAAIIRYTAENADYNDKVEKIGQLNNDLFEKLTKTDMSVAELRKLLDELDSFFDDALGSCNDC